MKTFLKLFPLKFVNANIKIDVGNQLNGCKKKLIK
jgi:hypothetical protein